MDAVRTFGHDAGTRTVELQMLKVMPYFVEGVRHILGGVFWFAVVAVRAVGADVETHARGY